MIFGFRFQYRYRRFSCRFVGYAQGYERPSSPNYQYHTTTEERSGGGRRRGEEKKQLFIMSFSLILNSFEKHKAQLPRYPTSHLYTLCYATLHALLKGRSSTPTPFHHPYTGRRRDYFASNRRWRRRPSNQPEAGRHKPLLRRCSKIRVVKVFCLLENILSNIHINESR